MISVVIPVYNAESFISKCVGSVLEQTFSDLELICVDDCSKDGSSKLLDGFDDSRVRVIRFAENRGVSAARNAGLEAAVGDYVYFLDSDDWLDPDYLEAMFLKAQETGEDIIVNSNYIEEFPNEGKRALSSRFGFVEDEPGYYPMNVIQNRFPARQTQCSSSPASIPRSPMIWDRNFHWPSWT